MLNQPLLVRAFDLARSGQSSNLTDLQRRLAHEGYMAVELHFRGPSVRRQLRALFQQSRRSRAL